MNFVFILPDKDAGVASVIRNLTRYKSSKFYTKVILLHNHMEDPGRRIKAYSWGIIRAVNSFVKMPCITVIRNNCEF